MASIFTQKGEEIFVDDEDLDLVSQFTWSIYSHGYPYSRLPGPGDKKISLHRLLLNPPKGFVGDHKNGNKLDARRHNLQVITQKKNIRKQKMKTFSGIRFRFGSFEARIMVDKKEVFLGCHKTFDLALLARIVGEVRYWGEPTQQMP